MAPPEITSNLVLRSTPVEIYRFVSTSVGEQPWLAWEPESLLRQFKQVSTPVAQDKLLAVQAAATNTAVTASNSWAFEKVVTAFNNNHCIVDS